MQDQFSRTELLIKKEGLQKLHNAKVAIFGLGGVGSFATEALARAGVGTLVLIDNDEVDVTNLNRQLIATTKTIGKPKVEVEKERILDINPNANVKTYQEFFTPETKTNIIEEGLTYVLDCIDTVTAKIEIVVRCSQKHIPVISAMGTGNKLDPSKFEITDIYKTHTCPLAKVMRHELRKRNIKNLKVIYSTAEPIKLDYSNYNVEENNGRHVPGSISFVPSVAGLMMAGEVIRKIIK